MNIQQAREKIKNAKAENSTSLNLSSFLVEEKLTSKDLTELLPELKELTALTTLYLSYNQISDIEVLGQLTSLTSLDLSGTQISNIEVLGQLTSLTSLDLSGTQISDIEVLGQLTSLTRLVLSNNQISDIEVLGQLTSLTELDLSGNQISDIEVLKELKHLNYLYISNNPIENPPIAIANQGIRAIRKYFEDNKKQNYEYVYETKVLIVGETETGKTTLFNRLLDPKYLPSTATKAKKKSTVGINIKTWEFPYANDSQETIKANLWDFGGQEIQYTLHQYFLTKSSFYIFLISNRVGDNEKIHKADYWFKVISALGKDCPVLVILNERNDKSANTFDINKYIKQFGANLGAIEKLDVDFDKNDHRWDYLLETLKRKISNLPHIGEETAEEKKRNYKKGLPEKWIKIREELETLAANNNYIERSVYDEICKRIGVYENPKEKKKDEILSQDLLLRFLHNLGVIINFENALLRKYLILNPNWLTESLYLILENRTIKDELRGKITSRFIEKLWKSKNYSDEDYQILLNLMLKDNFEIAYKVEGKEDDYVIPMLLPDVPLKYEFETENVITLIFRFIFLPYDVFSRLVVQLNDYIDVQNGNGNGNEKQLVWKNGMFLNSNRGSIAEVIESNNREQTPKEIKIRVSGENIDENKRFLSQIVSRIYQINDNWFNNNLEFDELIPCICQVCKEIEEEEEKQFYAHVILNGYLSANEYEIVCNKSAKMGNLQRLSINGLLDSVFIELPKMYGDNYNSLKEIQSNKEAKRKILTEQIVEAKSESKIENIIIGSIYNFYGGKQHIIDAEHNVSINQNIYKDSSESKQKMDELFSEINTKYESKLDEIISKQSELNTNYEKTVSDLKVQIQNMLDETLSVIGIGLEYLDGEEQRRFEELQQKADWENTLTFTVPLLDKLGIKIETKTKLEKLPEKFKDQIALLQERAKEMTLSESKTPEIEASKVKGELKE